jgi:hypothetical protein
MIIESLDAFLNDFGVAVVWNSVSGLAIFDLPDQIVGGSGISISTEYQLTAKVSDYGNAKYGEAITVDGVAYTVRENTKLDDGKFCRITLQKT